jgi:hypothetical protein
LLYDEVMDKLITASDVEHPKNCFPFFKNILKNEVPDGYTKNNKQKYKYVSTKTPRDMTDKEYLPLPGKGNLTQKVKGLCAFPDHGRGRSTCITRPFSCRGLLYIKVFSTYGMIAKNFAMATETLNYALDTNHVVVPHSKCIRQRLQKLQDQSVRQWLEELCNAFLGDDSQRTYQGGWSYGY